MDFNDTPEEAEYRSRARAWLDANAPNWTIVLVESVVGERYSDAEGQSYTGLDAVDNALGRGLPNRTGFGQLVDSRTGEANAQRPFADKATLISSV